MIKKFLIAGTALAAIAAYSVASQPVEAGSCIVASAKARALNDVDEAPEARDQPLGAQEQGQGREGREEPHHLRQEGPAFRLHDYR